MSEYLIRLLIYRDQMAKAECHHVVAVLDIWIKRQLPFEEKATDKKAA